MSSTPQASSSSSSTPNFQTIFEKALKEYKKKTGQDLTTHPLSAEINGCDSPDAIITVLQAKANELGQRNDERLTKWLTPTVNVLNVLSTTLGKGVGMVFPPTDIIFSGISILLVAAKDTAASREALVELFDRIEGFFSRLKTYTEIPPTAAITGVMAKIMAEVLQMLAIATKRLGQGRTKTFFKKVAGMNDVEDALQRLDKLEQRELRTVIAQMANDSTALKDGLKRIEGMAQRLVTDGTDRESVRVLCDLMGWLCPPDPSINHNFACDAQHERTLWWLFKDNIFMEWESMGSLLWIHGKPGSGKSVLCSAIIQHIVAQHKAKSASIAYFYFDFKDTEKQHQSNLLRSLLIQLSANSLSCYNILYHVYFDHGKGTRQPSDGALRRCLKAMLSEMTQHPNYIVVDALDECPDTAGVPSAREAVLGLINDLVDLRLPNLHICVTSRPEIDIRTVLGPSASRHISLHDQPGQKEDIAKYIRFVVHSDVKMKRWREDDRKLVIEVLSEKADGMFRWVFCQLEMLRHCLAPSLLRQLNDLPQSLDETYERILREIHSTNQDNARRLLHCLAVAQRPLRIEELAEVLTFDLDAAEGEIPTFHAEWRWEDHEQVVLSACSSLIIIVSSQGSRVVQFSHFSVKEFLTSKRLAAAAGDVSQHHILLEPAHTILAQACLGVLLNLDDRVDELSAKNIPLANYAAEHWVSHAQVDNVSTHIRHAMETLFDSKKPYILAWLKVYCVDPPRQVRSVHIQIRGIKRGHLHHIEIPRVYAKPLYYGSLYGFYNLVEQLVVKDPQHVNAVGGNHDFPLLAALWGKHFRVAEFLLEHGANIDIQGPKNETPLHKGLGWSDDSDFDAMQFLLKHGADVNATQDDLSTPLHQAATEGRFKAAQLLLAHKANVDSRDRTGKAPLHLVSSVANCSDLRPRLVQLLLEYDADANVKDEDYATPLHYASEYQRQDIAQILLDHGAKADAKNHKHLTPLHLLFSNQYGRSCSIGFVQLLLENGAEVNAQDENYETALHLASRGGKRDIAHILLNRGANVDAANSRGETPLHQVSRELPYLNQGDPLCVAQLLLERGADVNAQDNDHITPLHLASEYGRLEMARVLLDHGAEVNAKNDHGETPLHRSSKGKAFLLSECRVAQLLLDHGADVNARDKDNVTPLHLASNNTSFEVAQVLVACGADVNAKNDRGETPLFLLIEVSRFSLSGYSKLDLIGILVEHGADANTRGGGNTTALHLASKYGQSGVARVLLDRGANVDAKGNLTQGWIPFRELASVDDWGGTDCPVVIPLFVRSDVDENLDEKTQDEDYETPLHLACEHGQLDTALVLLDHGATVDAENSRGRTPLHISSQGTSCSDWQPLGPLPDIVRLLLERGANANARDKDNATPLHLAFSRPRFQLISVLLDCGANTNAKDNLGRAPLHRLLNSRHLYEKDYLQFVHLLLAHGVDVNAQDEEGASALHSACDHHNHYVTLEVAKVLCNNGANPNVENNLGETPLHRLLKNTYFSEDHHLDAVELLLEYGANPNAQDRDGVTLLHLTSHNGRIKAAALLSKHGAKDASENE